MARLSELESLRAIMNESLDVLQSELIMAQMPELFISKAETHPLDDPHVLPSTKLFEARRVLLAALRMIGATVQSPSERLLEEGWQHQIGSSLQAVTKYKIAERLADAAVEPKAGVLASDLADESGVYADQLTRVMRMLASHHFFRETAQGRFANNRASLDLIPPKPASKGVQLTSGYCLHISARAVDSLRVDEPLSAAQLAFGFEGDFFAWLQTNLDYFETFAGGMTGLYDAAAAGLMADYPWGRLKSGTVVVDIGGGEGGLGMAIASAFPKLHVISQDRPEVRAAAVKNWETHIPTVLQEGRIRFEASDFFTPQLRKGEQYLFIMRCIIHDWSHAECVQILQNLRSAMTPTSRLLIIEHVITPPITTEDRTPNMLSSLDNSEPYAEMEAPWPLPKGSQVLELVTDYAMWTTFKSGKERTPREWSSLLNESGMKVVNIWPTRTEFSIVEVGIM